MIKILQIINKGLNAIKHNQLANKKLETHPHIVGVEFHHLIRRQCRIILITSVTCIDKTINLIRDYILIGRDLESGVPHITLDSFVYH